MSPSTVLVTGANGFLGFRVLIAALKSGYTVRATVRREDSAAQIRAAESTQPFLKQLEIVIVPDILEEGAFDEAVAGIEHVLHLASPVSRASEDYYNDFIVPALNGTMSLLRSVERSGSVKRVVITSSLAVLDVAKGSAISVDDLGAIPDAHDAFPNPFAAYSASKKIALAAISEYVQQTNPKFDIINILPSVILGRNELATSRSDYLSGTNRYIVNIILGNDSPTAMPGVVVFVDDCAEVHVMALREDVNGNQNFTTSSGSVMWSDVNAIVKKEFASEVETEGLVLGGKMDTISLTLDVEKTVETFGISWVPFAEQVKSVVKHYLSLE